MMETGSASFGLMQFLILLFGGQSFNLIPGERDELLMKSAPESAYVYSEWTARGPGQPGAPGIEGLLADPEIETLVAGIQQALAANEGEADADLQAALRAEVPGLLAIVARHAGGLYLARDGEQAAAQGFALIPPLEAAVILNLDNELETFVAKLNKILRWVPNFEVPAQYAETRIPTRTLPVDLRLHQEGPRLILSVGSQTLNRLRARWQQQNSGVAQSALFQQSLQQTQVEKFGGLVWLNLASLRGDLLTRLGFIGPLIQNIMQPLGLNGIDSVLTVSGIEKHDQISRTQIALNGPGEGVLALFSGRPIAAGDLSQVPADADFVAAVSLNLNNVHSAVRTAAWRILPWLLRGVDFSSGQFEQDLQLRLADLFGGFGEVWTLYDSPSNGGFALTGMVATVPVRDSAQAQAVVGRIRELINQSLPEGSEEWKTTLETASFDGQTIYFLNSTGDQSVLEPDERSLFSPAFCLTQDQFVVGMHPPALKAHLRFLKSSDTRFSKTIVSQIPGDALAQMYLNTPRVVQTIYPLLPLVLKPVFAELQAQGIPINVSVVPSARAVLPYVRNTTATLVRRQDGLFLEQRNTLPVLVGMAVVPAAIRSGMNHNSGAASSEQTAGGVQLGAPAGADGVVQAKSDQPASPKPTEETPVGSAARRVVPGFLRGLIPDVAQPFVPPDAFDNLGQPLDPQQAAEREAERQRRKEAREARRNMRRGIPPTKKPATPTPPQPSPP